ncbi:MAG: GTP 3',8-cyclase MoaA [Vicinamibacteraceae bacterium]
METTDRFGRPLGTLRVSVTDRCNLRCTYCMPEAEYVWLPRADLLTFEEIDRIVSIFVALGVARVRLTGGEPLLRRDLPSLVRRLAARPGLQERALTTNGVHLADQAAALRDAGLDRVTVSLDTLDAARFLRLSRSRDLDAVLAGIDAAAATFGGLKIDTVVIRDENDGELPALVEYAGRVGAEIRFIEYMDVGGATRWAESRVVPRTEILARLESAYGPPTPIGQPRQAPATRYALPNGQVIGVIASTTQPFCGDCDRARLTADGQLLTCLYATSGLDLRGPLRAGATDGDLAALVGDTWRRRVDRGAEARLAVEHRAAFIPRDALRAQPHLEMHTRGG